MAARQPPRTRSGTGARASAAARCPGDFSLLAPPFVIEEARVAEAAGALRETPAEVCGAW